jgi:acyl carrier protein phosphodiesterase
MVYGKQTKVMVVFPSKRMNFVLDDKSIAIQESLGALNEFVVSDWLVRYRKLARLFVGLASIRNRRSRNFFDFSVIYESAIATADVKVNFRSGGVFCVIHNYNNIVI